MATSRDPVAAINNVLDARIHQVVGSTPKSIRKTLEESSIKGNANIGMLFVGLSIFAASVNKKATEELYTDNSMAPLRNAVMNLFTINNKINMTSFSLAGHCFMTHPISERITYAKEFKRKMGQSSIWDGDFRSAKLSEKQRTIYNEKKNEHTKEEAFKLADWFIKYVGMQGTTPINQQPPIVESDDDGLYERGPPAPPSVPTPRTRQKMPLVEPATAPKAPASTAHSLLYEIPEDVKTFFLDEGRGTQKELDLLVESFGVEEAFKSIRTMREKKRASDNASQSVVGSSVRKGT